MKFADQVLQASATLRDKVDQLTFAHPVAFVYNPLQYAWSMHEKYIRAWGATPRRVLFLGMNPGPWGMAQTGIPFGEIGMVKNFLGLSGEVGRPIPEHPKRPILGLATSRSEVSGRRLWGYFGEKFGGAEGFFEQNIVVNYCPLVFMEDSARNRTPDKLPKTESRPLFAACDERLIALVDLYQPEWVVGVGGFARKKLDSLWGKKSAISMSVVENSSQGSKIKIGTVLHPSPASPAANRGWAEAAQRQLTEQGIWEG